MSTTQPRTTVSVSHKTKSRLDIWRATGQCYDGFLCQLIGLWEKTHQVNESYKLPDTEKALSSNRSR
jgi:hypothetical protein